MTSTKNIYLDFKRYKLIIAILCFGMIPLWLNGYCNYLIILLLPLLTLTSYNKISFTILIFSLFYTLNIILMGGSLTPSAIAFYSIYPIIIYQTTLYLTNRFKDRRSPVLLLALIALFMGVPAIIDSIYDAVNSQTLINISRKILRNNDEVSRSATGYGMMLAPLCGCIGLLIIKSRNKFDTRLKALLIVSGALALFSTIHIVNRTGLFIAILSTAFIMFSPPYSKSKLIYTSLSIGILIAIYFYYIEPSSSYADIVKAYEFRNEGVGNIEDAGGRTGRWWDAVVQIINQPLGNPNGFWHRDAHKYNYAHNLILDGGIKGGIICFISLIYLFFKLLQNILRCQKSKYLNQLERTVIILLSFASFLQCMTEPVIEGVTQLFWFILICLGTLYTLNRKYD